MGARGADPSWRQIRKLALADLERVVEIDPKQAQAWVLIARLNIVLPNGDARRAAEAVDRALAASEDSPSIRSEALVMRAAIAKALSAKLADLNEAVKLAPKNAAAFRARGLAAPTTTNSPSPWPTWTGRSKSSRSTFRRLRPRRCSWRA